MPRADEKAELKVHEWVGVWVVMSAVVMVVPKDVKWVESMVVMLVVV